MIWCALLASAAYSLLSCTGSWPIDTFFWVCPLSMHSHRITVLLRTFHSLVKESSELFSLIISIPQTGSTVHAICISAKWFTIFPISKTVSVQKIPLYTYTNILSYLYHIFYIAMFVIQKKVSVCVSFHIHFKMKWKKLPLQGIFIGEAYNLLWLHKSKCSHAAKYG